MANKKKPEGRVAKVRKFVRDTASEFRKIVWPSGKQVINNTIVVLVTMLVFAVIIWLLDYGFNALREWGIGALTAEEIEETAAAFLLTGFRGF